MENLVHVVIQLLIPYPFSSYLDIEDSDEPYLDGIKYHAMPPLKRFRDMEHLSGGEKTMAALALLFAVHSYQPSPFFVLDEVDAALDNTNVARIANYIRDHAAPGMQFIVISLKTGLFQLSEALVGVYRDQTENSSNSLTLDVRDPPLQSMIISLSLMALLTYETAPQISVDMSQFEFSDLNFALCQDGASDISWVSISPQFLCSSYLFSAVYDFNCNERWNGSVYSLRVF